MQGSLARSPDDAIAAPLERLAYVDAFDPAGHAKDAMTVLDRDPSSPDDGQAVGWSELASSLRMGGCRAPGNRAPGLPSGQARPQDTLHPAKVASTTITGTIERDA